jgi:DNA mismatch endonuclease (patch repair protein)
MKSNRWILVLSLPLSLPTFQKPNKSRSENMRAIRSEGMQPEMAVRRLVHRLGYRYRLHRKDLPGKPDLAFASRQKVIFVHGCFWHGHNCHRSHVPRSNELYWQAKIKRNRYRDRENLESLESLGWAALVIWECEVRDISRISARIRSFL